VIDAEETLAALRRRGDATVDRLLRENESRWQSMSDADRRTAELLARTVASRLFDLPARRLATEPPAEREAHAAALSNLFAVAEPAPPSADISRRRGRA
jgi:glutamyl-tRNA reductase